jgi:hypothetical protein
MDTNTTRHSLRIQALQALGGCCNRCGISDPDVLDIHHALNNGKIDRERRKKTEILLSIIKGELLEMFEILCANCHRKHHKMFPVERRPPCTRKASPNIVEAVAKHFMRKRLRLHVKKPRTKRTIGFYEGIRIAQEQARLTKLETPLVVSSPENPS